MKPLFYLGLIVAGVLLWAIGRADGRGSLEDPALDRQTAGALQLGSTWRGRHAKDSAESAGLRLKLEASGFKRDQERARADSAAQLAGRARIQLDSARSAADSLQAYPLLVEQLTLHGDHLEAALAHALERDSLLWIDRDRWRAAADTAGVALDAMDVALRAERAARRCRILGLIPCPSRKTSVAIGAIGGLVLRAVLAR